MIIVEIKSRETSQCIVEMAVWRENTGFCHYECDIQSVDECSDVLNPHDPSLNSARLVVKSRSIFFLCIRISNLDSSMLATISVKRIRHPLRDSYYK